MEKQHLLCNKEFPSLKVNSNSHVYAITDYPKPTWFDTGITEEEFNKGQNYYTYEPQGTSLRINLIGNKLKIFMKPKFYISNILKNVSFCGITLWKVINEEEIKRKHYYEESPLTHSKFIKEYKINKLYKYIETHKDKKYIPSVLFKTVNDELVYLEHYIQYKYKDGFYFLSKDFYEYHILEIKFKLLENDKIIYYDSKGINKCSYPCINSELAYYFLFDKKYILKKDLKNITIELGNVYHYLYKYEHLAKPFTFSCKKYYK